MGTGRLPKGLPLRRLPKRQAPGISLSASTLSESKMFGKWLSRTRARGSNRKSGTTNNTERINGMGFGTRAAGLFTVTPMPTSRSLLLLLGLRCLALLLAALGLLEMQHEENLHRWEVAAMRIGARLPGNAGGRSEWGETNRFSLSSMGTQ
jgi:hypothetical protein